MSRPGSLALVLLLAACAAPRSTSPADPLPSWGAGEAKSTILGFVDRVTREGGPDYVPPGERIAVFDNDGTLWPEQPAYFQLLFTMDRVRTLAGGHPEWKTRQPFQGVLEGDMEAVLASGEHGLIELVTATHGGCTTEEFADIVGTWIAEARHPRFAKRLTACVYVPMLEVLELLRANGFRTWIVSGGGIEFMRPWSQSVYGIPPEQVIGSSLRTQFEMRDGEPVLVRLPEFDFINDKEGKPVGIERFIGRRPIAAFGNSDGDLQMLQWTAAGAGPRLACLIHHTDAEREWAYDRQSKVGRLDRALAEAARRGWTVVDMRRDWKRIYAFEGR